MTGLGELLGQNQTASALVDALEAPGARVARLTGPSGSGKSHIALLAGATWQSNGGHCVVAVGDDNSSSRSLHPYLVGLAALPMAWTGLAGQGSRSALGIADTVVGARGVGTSLFDLLASAFRQRVERALMPFSALERGIILDFKRLARARPLLLIADNAHWWDPDSLWLLGEMLADPLRTAVQQLNAMAVLVVDTAGEQPAAPEQFAAIIERCTESTWHARRCTRAEFPSVLEALGATEELPEEIVEQLYIATGGHLKVAEQLVGYSETHDLRQFIADSDGTYLTALLASRIGSLGGAGQGLVALLSRAAVIGLSFEVEELECLAEGLPGELRDLIDRAERISLLRRGVGRLSFSHDIVRTAVLRGQTPTQLRFLRTKFAECLAILRPGDYVARADLLIQAGEIERGRELFGLASVAQLRRAVPAARVLRNATIRFPDDDDLQAFLEMMAAAYGAVARGEYRDPLPRLKSPSPTETLLLAAERNYLVALCCVELQTVAGADEARQILNSWQTSLRGEPELSVRYLLLLQQVQVLSEMFEEARATERDIERRLVRRARYDQEAAVMLQVQNRRAAAIDVPEVAELRIADAVLFFRNGTGDSTRDRLELFRALNNLAAIQIRLGKDAAAYATATEASRVAIDSPEAVTRLDVLASNLVLAAVRSGAMSIEAAVERQRLIIESPDGAGDKFIHRCNLAAYLLLASLDEEALAELTRLADELQSRDFVESYLVFYWSALDATATALRGEIDSAIVKHRAMDTFVAGLKWPCAGYVRRRQDLLGEYLGGVTPSDERRDTDCALLAGRPSEIGPAWSYYGRLLPCCELSFWSDS